MIYAALLASSLTGCELFTPERRAPLVPVATQASFDGNQQDSGLILVDPVLGALVTERFVARYAQLIKTYGQDHRLGVPLKAGDGVGPASDEIRQHYVARGQVFWMTKAALADFIRMNQWHKAASK